MSDHSVAIILLTYNSLPQLEEFLPIVVANSPKYASIYIIDNASEDGSHDFVTQQYSDIKWIQHKKNYGFAAGYDHGLREVEEEYWVLLNADVEVTPNWLAPLISRLESNESIAVVQPKIKAQQKRNHFEHAGASGGFIDRFGYTFCRGRIFDKTEVDTGQYEEPIPCFWASGACMAIKKSVYYEVGGFDHRFFMHMEEIDLCWRIQRMGYEIFCEPSSTIYHVGGGSLAYDNPKKTYFNFRNNLIMLHKNLPAGSACVVILLRVCLDWIAAFREMLNLRFSNTFAIGIAWLMYLRGILFWKRSFNHKQHNKINTIYQKSILRDFFFLNNKLYSSLRHEDIDRRR